MSEPRHQHVVEQSGWTVVIRAVTGREFIALGGVGSPVGCAFFRTRAEARAYERELHANGMRETYVSRATVRFQRHA